MLLSQIPVIVIFRKFDAPLYRICADLLIDALRKYKIVPKNKIIIFSVTGLYTIAEGLCIQHGSVHKPRHHRIPGSLLIAGQDKIGRIAKIGFLYLSFAVGGGLTGHLVMSTDCVIHVIVNGLKKGRWILLIIIPNRVRFKVLKFSDGSKAGNIVIVGCQDQVHITPLSLRLLEVKLDSYPISGTGFDAIGICIRGGLYGYKRPIAIFVHRRFKD